MNTQENNKMIAEFMGLDIIPLEQFVLGVQSTIARIKIGRKDYICPMTEGYLLEHLQYHTSWDWLMTVVDKIEDYLSANVGKVGYFDECLSSNDLEVRYQAVVEFINQYNKNK